MPNGAAHVTRTVAVTVARSAPRTSPSLDRRPRIEGGSPFGRSVPRAGVASAHGTRRGAAQHGPRRLAVALRVGALREGELFTSISGVEVEPLATPETAGLDYERDLGYPGSFLFTRGVYPSMYRGRLWTMRQFAGFGTAHETNERFRYLLEHGQTGLSCAFDMPALMGVDWTRRGRRARSAARASRWRRSRTCVLFAGIPLGEVSTSMTINSSAAIALAMYLVVGEEQGVPRERLRGTIQTDILKEYIAQKEFIFPPGPSMRLVTDMVEFCARDAAVASDLDLGLPHPRGGLDRGAGAGVHAQERLHLRRVGALERGLDVDAFAPRLSFFFNAHFDFFEEIAKYRAARRIWARELRERYGARDERSPLMRLHTQTAGVSLTWQQPSERRAHGDRGARGRARRDAVAPHQLLRREALALPTEDAVRPAADATGDRARDRRRQHDRPARRLLPRRGASPTGSRPRPTSCSAGSTSSAGWSPRSSRTCRSAIADAYRYQQEVEADERIVVGVNRYQHDGEDEIHILRIDLDVECRQTERLRAFKAGRDSPPSSGASPSCPPRRRSRTAT